MDVEMVKILSNFGIAGMIFIVWWLDRKEISKRGRMLDEAHTMLRSSQETTTILTDLVQENTRVLERLTQLIENKL